MKKLSMDELNRLNVEQFKEKEKIPVVIVLDNVRSALNVGSVFRTADAFAVKAIYLCGITATPENREVMKTSLGAEKSVVWKYFATTSEALSELKGVVGQETNNGGVKIFALEQVDESISLEKFHAKAQSRKEEIAFVFGNEVNGVSEECFPFLDGCIEIPQFGTKHSFNISVTVGIVLWDYHLKNLFPQI